MTEPDDLRDDRRRVVETEILRARHLWEHGELTEAEFRDQEQTMRDWLARVEDS